MSMSLYVESGAVALFFGPASWNCGHSLLVYSDSRHCRVESDEQDLLKVDSVSNSALPQGRSWENSIAQSIHYECSRC